jgi:antibiotic biosynthesis monooxygenase (ABM) superfamily enzyme
MDWYGSTVIIDKNTKMICVDDEFEESWNSDPHIQAWISALKSVYETKDGDNKAEGLNTFIENKMEYKSAVRD